MDPQKTANEHSSVTMWLNDDDDDDDDDDSDSCDDDDVDYVDDVV